jgi:hypothetical protein
MLYQGETQSGMACTCTACYVWKYLHVRSCALVECCNCVHKVQQGVHMLVSLSYSVNCDEKIIGVGLALTGDFPEILLRSSQ